MAKAGCQTSNCNYDYDDFIDIFMVNENTPIKTIRIKYYIVHYSETDPRNFELSNPVHLAFLEETVAFNENIISNMYIETAADCQEHQCHVDGFTHNVTDAKIRFAVDYEEVVDATLWNADPYSMGVYKNALKTNFLTGDNTHVAYFLTGSQCLYEKFVLQNNETCNQPWANTGHSQWIQYTVLPLHYTNFDGHSAIVAPAVYAKYAAQNNGYFCEEHPNDCCPACPESWQLGSGIVHELGHVIGLNHTKQKPNVSPAEFYCETNIMHPGGYRRYLNDVQIAQWHRGISQKNVRNAVVNCESSDQNLEINRDQTWNYSTKLYQNILVKAPYTLTITCELQMINNGKIFIEPGARLVVDGGIITKGCDEFWGGIEVWGNSNLNQYGQFGVANQGKVELINGAVIEYAKDAISLIKIGDINTTGGIVNSNNATFKNNKRSVAFYQYDFNSLSSFINTTFTVDNDFLEGQDFNTHVTMWAVRGVKFYGCRFYNEMSDGLFDDSHNKGIYSIDAGYLIHAYCSDPGAYTPPCSQQYLIPSEFRGFSYGVQASTTGSMRTVSIDQTTFTENYFGVWMDKQDGFRVVRSQFEVGDSELEDSNDQNQKGLYSIKNSRFTIEDNMFEGTQNGNYSKGIRIDDTDAVSTRTYNNHFIHLYIGQNLRGYNRDKYNAYIGYQSLCNKHHENQETEHVHDILVEEGDANTDAGILLYQGNPLTLKSSGNTFSHTNTNAYSDVFNDVAWGVIFFHTGNNTEPIYVNGNVAKTLVDNAHECISNFVREGFTYDVHYEVKSNSKRNELLSSFDSLELEFAYLLYNYHQLIDGGSTSDLVAQVQSTWPQEAWDLHDDLMNQSPYLSTQVLIGTIDQDILPHALFLEVCLANPDATSRDEGFLYYIEFDAGNPLPNYMVELIRGNSDSITARTLMEVELAHQYAGMSYISELLITDFQLDTISNLSDIRYWLHRRNQLPDRYALVESYLEDFDYGQGAIVYSEIANDFDLRDDWEDAYNDYGDYLALWEQIPGSGNTWLDLDSNQLTDLVQMAINHKGYSQRYAANILCFFFQDCRYIPRPDSHHSPRPQANQTTNVTLIPEVLQLFKIFPNPAGNYTSIAWELEETMSKTYLEIYDITGKVMNSHKVNVKLGEWVVDTRNFPNGVYTCRLVFNGRVLQSQTLMINR